MLKLYFVEFKNRMFLVLLCWSSVLIVSYFYKEILIFLLIKPNLSLFNFQPLYFISTNLTDIFYTYVRLSMFLSNQLTLIYIFYHIILFFTPGLYLFEYNKIKDLFFLFCVLNVISITFLHKFLIPISWKFFFSFQTAEEYESFHIFFEIKIVEYFSFYKSIYYMSILNCLFFTVLIISIGYIKKHFNIIKKIRKILYILFFLIATLTTPPDVFSQLTVGIACICFFELTIIYIILKNSVDIKYLGFNLVTN